MTLSQLNRNVIQNAAESLRKINLAKYFASLLKSYSNFSESEQNENSNVPKKEIVDKLVQNLLTDTSA